MDSKVQGGDTTYAMPNFGELPGFAEAARAFQHTGASTEIPEPVLQLIASHEPKISEKDVESLINEVVSKSGLSRSAPQIAEFIAEALSNVGAARAALSSLREVGLRAADAAKAEAGGDETPQQKMTRLWAEIDEAEKKIKGGLEQANEWGYITDEELQHHQASQKRADDLQAYADSLPENHPDKARATQAAAEATRAAAEEAQALGDKAKDAAHRDGHPERVDVLDTNVSKPADVVIARTDEIKDVVRLDIEARRERTVTPTQEVDRSALVVTEMQARPETATQQQDVAQAPAPRSMYDAAPVNQEVEPVRLAVATVAEVPTASPSTPVTEAQRNAGASVTL